MFSGAFMSKTEDLKAMVATMLMVSTGDVDSETSLKTLATSLGSAKLRLALKRLGLAQPAGPVPTTFGSLAAAVSGEGNLSSVQPRVAPSPNVANFGDFEIGALPGGLQVGVDVEDIRSLPTTLDYWEDEFYRTTFARSEIAYAVLQAEPKTHFAGFWCAKEALRKCDPAFRALNMVRTAVAHDAAGRPYLTTETDSGVERLGHALSISHTTEVATAVVILAHHPERSQVASIETGPAPSRQWKEPSRMAKLFSGK
jgi:phosphopantetheine--protein transferase-like protein